MKIAHVTSGVCRLVFVIVALHPPLPAARPMVPRMLPVVTQKLTVPAVTRAPGRCRQCLADFVFEGGVVQETVPLYLPEL